MKLAEYLARRRRARVAAVMLFALIMGFVSAAPPVVTGCQAQDLTPAPDTSMLSPPFRLWHRSSRSLLPSRCRKSGSA